MTAQAIFNELPLHGTSTHHHPFHIGVFTRSLFELVPWQPYYGEDAGLQEELEATRSEDPPGARPSGFPSTDGAAIRRSSTGACRGRCVETHKSGFGIFFPSQANAEIVGFPMVRIPTLPFPLELGRTPDWGWTMRMVQGERVQCVFTSRQLSPEDGLYVNVRELALAWISQSPR